jgi:primosomal protein N' (replication factor Y)
LHGRAGREGKKGNVIIQTYNPDSFPIECAKEQNYLKFYKQEIKLRKVLKYPPFCDIIKIEVSDFDENNTKGVINAVYENLLKANEKEMQIYAPMPSPISKVKSRYRWRIIVKCKMRKKHNK